MGLFQKTPEQLAEQEQRRLDDEARRRARQAEKEAQEFRASPVGQARAAFERGDLLFQTSIDVMNQQAIIVAMIGSSTSQRTTDPSAILNAISREGWDLASASFTFIEEGQQSRDKFMSSGQNVAVKGRTAGYYVFKRAPQLRQPNDLAPPQSAASRHAR